MQPVKYTLRNLIDLFRRIYGLGDFNLAHESVHAATGYDVSLADELRVDIILSALNGKSLWRAKASARKLYKTAIAAFETAGAGNAFLPRLAEKDFCAVQAHTVMLDKKEIEAQYNLGLRIGDRIRALTGKSKKELAPEEIARLAFVDMDFTVHASAIKEKYETPENRAVRKTMARKFQEAARRAGRGEDIPEPGVPWNSVTASAPSHSPPAPRRDIFAM